MGEQRDVRLPGHRTLGNIDDADDVLVLLPCVSKGSKGIGRLPGLRYKEGKAALRHVASAIPKFRSDIDLCRDAGNGFEPVFGDKGGVIGRTAADDSQFAHPSKIKGQCRYRDDLVPRIEQCVKSIADNRRLLVNLLQHEMREVTLADQRTRRRRQFHRPVDDRSGHVVDGRTVAADLNPVAFLKITDAAGQRGQCQRVGAQIHLAISVTDGERTPTAGANHHIVMPGKEDSEGERALQPTHGSLNRLLRVVSFAEKAADEMDDNFRVGFRLKFTALRRKLSSQIKKILDDAVVNKNDPTIGMRMRVYFGRRAVSGPAGMTDPNRSRQRFIGDERFEVNEFTLRPSALDRAVGKGGDARRVISPIFQAPQSVDEQRGDLSVADDADDATHARQLFNCVLSLGLFGPTPLTKRRRPPLLFCMGAAGQGQCVSRNVAGNHAAGTDDRSRTDLTGATSDVLDPMKAPAPTSVISLKNPS